ncbi:MAG TPA: TonB-dependent receptor [Micropepsaceae bacterium]|nr:TonB-dependent receptor [Micropepsaceae bacterium]
MAMFGALALPPAARAQAVAADSIENLQRLSIEELANLQVTSVSKVPESLSDAPAALYVITHQDIIRSGARRIPDILRLAPNLEVFQTSPDNYVITARGLSGNSAAQNFSNKIEVLIDGRTVYNPLFSGVYWEMQNVLPENIERIEVISGPSATLWGANAVNGVVNIITRRAGDTQGGFVGLDGGNFESRAAAQYGGRVGDGFAWRAYGQAFYERGFEMQSRQGAHDGWSNPQGGFRLDWTHANDVVSLEGDASYGHEGQTGGPAQDFSEKSLTASWQHEVSPTSTLQLLSYADQVQRYETGQHDGFTVTNYDLEGQYTFDVAGWNHFLAGAGDRVTPYGLVPRIGTANSLEWQPTRRTINLIYGMIQDTVSVTGELNLIFGLKLENDPYYGLSPLPSVRVAWKPNPGLLIWAAVSHAIRAPTTFDEDVREFAGSTLFLEGNPNFQPERLNAFELGDRAQFGNASVSVSGFYNLYTDLRSIEITPVTFTPLFWGNGLEGHVYGVESWASYQPLPWWRLDAGLTVQHEHFGFAAGSSGLLGTAQVGDDPHTQARLRSSMDFGPLSFDANFRYVGSLPNPAVPAYIELDSRIAWRISPMTEIAVSGMNLLHAHHQEWTIPPSDEIPRMVFIELRQNF